jgi:hypothetical protein
MNDERIQELAHDAEQQVLQWIDRQEPGRGEPGDKEPDEIIADAIRTAIEELAAKLEAVEEHNRRMTYCLQAIKTLGANERHACRKAIKDLEDEELMIDAARQPKEREG